MPVYDSRAMPLLQELKAANEAEGAAVKTLLEYMQGGGKDNKKLIELTDQLTSANNKQMRIYQELQQFRLDK